MKKIKAMAGMALSLGALSAIVPAAHAEFAVTGATGAMSIDGQISRQAGAHPDLTTTMLFTPQDHVHDIQVDLPAGLVGNPTAYPTCSAILLTASDPSGTSGGSSLCPVESQVGIVEIYDQPSTSTVPVLQPLYNMEPEPGEPAAFAFNYNGVIARIVPKVRATDYGLTAESKSISTGIPVKALRVTLWGIPADPSHDALRFVGDTYVGLPAGSPSAAPRLPFVTSPTSCPGTAATTTVRADSWQHVGALSSFTFDTDLDGTPFVMDGCYKLGFRPSVAVRPTAQKTDAPTGLDIDISVPQNEDPDGLATAHLKRAVVTLPKGFTVSPSSAQGLGACSLSDIKLGVDEPPTCPDSSKIGTVTVDTPLLEDPLEGDVILAKQNDNPFTSLLAMYLVVRGPGILIKLPGRIDADPVTGQLVTTFDNQPQVPFSKLRVKLRGGSRAPLASPETCGTFTTHTVLTSWASDTPVIDDAPMVIDSGCGARGFAPTLNAGVLDTTAGGSSPFTMTMSRKDGEQYFQGVNAVLPPGLLGNVGSVPRCPEAQAAAGTCGPESRVGTTSVLAGPGDTPLAVPQPGRSSPAVYLAGPYKGAPFSLSIVVPAQAGPFDLGTVVVRAGVYVDRTTAQVRVVSDPLPLILQGIPLRLRQVNVTIDRSGFMRNPTNCTPSQILGHITSAGTDGEAVDLSVPFGVGRCRDLDYTPKLALALTGKGQTTDGKHPALTATLTQSAVDQANTKSVKAALPLSMALDPDNANGLCEPTDAAADTCPAKSIVGHATAISPILDQPLTGPVYFVRGERTDAAGRVHKTLPKLYVPLTGENGIKVDLHAASEVEDDRLVTTFDQVPDAPVTNFKLEVNGGKHGILVVSDANLCTSNQVADSLSYGQNGASEQQMVTMSTPCTLGVSKTSHSSKALNVTVSGLGAGKVAVTGQGLTKKTKTISNATVATVAVPISKSVRRSLAHGHNVKIKVKVSYTPKGTKKVKTATKTITMHGAKKAKKK